MTAGADDSDRWAGLLEVTRRLATCLDLDELLAEIVRCAMALLDAERASVFLYDPQRRELISRVAAGAQEIRFSIDTGVAGACARSLETVVVNDAYADERFNPEIDRKTGFRTRNILSAATTDYQGDLVGVVQVLNKRSGAFDAADVDVAEALASQAGVALQRQMLLEHLLSKQQMEQALEIARRIQQSQWPAAAPEIAGWDIAGWSRPADRTGGDTFDYFEVDGSAAVLLADATGHGVGPALIIAQARAMIRALGRRGELPEVMRTVNELLATDLEDGRFVTCFVGLIGPGSGLVRYISAGQGPLLVYRRGDDRFEALNASDLPLGVTDLAEYAAVETLDLAGGDLLVVTTDGFFEAFDPAGRQFGVDRLCEVIRRNAQREASAIIAALAEAVDRFRGSRSQEDDLTAVVARRT